MGRMNREMQRIAIMQEFKWTYEDYQNTPNHVITLIIEKMKRDAKDQELKSKSHHFGH